MYTYVTMCRDYENGKITPPFIAEVKLKLFRNHDQAFRTAYDEACEECVACNRDTVIKGVDFGVTTDENNVVSVLYYYKDNTEIVTERIVMEIEKRR